MNRLTSSCLVPETLTKLPARELGRLVTAMSPGPVPNGRVIKAPLSWRIKNWFRMLKPGRQLSWWDLIPIFFLQWLFSGEHFIPARIAIMKFFGGEAVGVVHAALYGRVMRGDGTIVDYGLLGRHLVVTAGKNYIASTFDNTAEPENAKYHGYGTGTGAAAAGDTALGTEFTTEYVTNSTRPTGTQAHSSATYTTVGTFAPDSGGTLAVTEWGLFTANASTTLIDRQVFSAVNLVSTNGDSLATTYVLTIG